jgi:hypothetical protein
MINGFRSRKTDIAGDGAPSGRNVLWQSSVSDSSVCVSLRRFLSAFKWRITISETPKPDPPAVTLQVARALAIEEYANLESALSRLLANLLGTSFAKASIVFFSLLNTRARSAMFESLIAAVHGDKYRTFWLGQRGQPGIPRTNGLLALIRQVDQERNHVVHWHTIQASDRSSEQLMMPEFWFRDPYNAEPTSIGVPELQAFIAKTSFVARSVVMFAMFTSGDLRPADVAQTWSQIFQQPVSYPPSDTHPLSPNYKGPGTPPQSSPA